VDNDCSGGVDDGLPTQDAWSDGDGDGYGYGLGYLGAFCAPPAGSADDDLDCDDGDPASNPDASEICGNGVDEDCSGSADSCNFADFCVLQAPASVNVTSGQPFQVFTRVLEAGITDQTSGNDPDPSLVAELDGPMAALVEKSEIATCSRKSDTTNGAGHPSTVRRSKFRQRKRREPWLENLAGDRDRRASGRVL
jgi:hypothetical protein